jgi:hypothetical protein
MLQRCPPLNDLPEQKCSTEGLGQIAMTRPVRICLGILRAYLAAMTMMLGYHVLDLAGVLRAEMKRSSTHVDF